MEDLNYDDTELIQELSDKINNIKHSIDYFEVDKSKAGGNFRFLPEEIKQLEEKIKDIDEKGLKRIEKPLFEAIRYNYWKLNCPNKIKDDKEYHISFYKIGSSSPDGPVPSEKELVGITSLEECVTALKERLMEYAKKEIDDKIKRQERNIDYVKNGKNPFGTILNSDHEKINELLTSNINCLKPENFFREGSDMNYLFSMADEETKSLLEEKLNNAYNSLSNDLKTLE